MGSEVNSMNSPKSSLEVLSCRGELLIDDDEEDSDNDFDDLLLLQNLSLVVLVNAATAYGKILPELVRTPLIPILIRFLFQSKTNPSAAYRSAMCLEYCFDNSSNAATKTYNGEQLRTALDIAIRVGKERHANLFSEAKKRASVLFRI